MSNVALLRMLSPLALFMVSPFIYAMVL